MGYGTRRSFAVSKPCDHTRGPTLQPGADCSPARHYTCLASHASASCHYASLASASCYPASRLTDNDNSAPPKVTIQIQAQVVVQSEALQTATLENEAGGPTYCRQAAIPNSKVTIPGAEVAIPEPPASSRRIHSAIMLEEIKVSLKIPKPCLARTNP